MAHDASANAARLSGAFDGSAIEEALDPRSAPTAVARARLTRWLARTHGRDALGFSYGRRSLSAKALRQQARRAAAAAAAALAGDETEDETDETPPDRAHDGGGRNGSGAPDPLLPDARPKTRGECRALGIGGPGHPCPYVSCVWHLALDVSCRRRAVVAPDGELLADADEEAARLDRERSGAREAVYAARLADGGVVRPVDLDDAVAKVASGATCGACGARLEPDAEVCACGADAPRGHAQPNGTIFVVVPHRVEADGVEDLDLDAIEWTCALEAADRGDGMTLDQVGRVMGRTRERVRQLEAGAVAKIARTDCLDDFVPLADLVRRLKRGR